MSIKSSQAGWLGYPMDIVTLSTQKLIFMSLRNYSGTKCPKCDKAGFELVEDAPANSNYKYFYLRCSSCKAFLAFIEYSPFAEQILKLKEDIVKIKKHLGVIEGF